MKEGTQQEFEEVIENAKRLIMNKTKYGQGEDANRPWRRVRAKHESWLDGSMDIELIMFEGSPAKGYILVNYGTKNIIAFGPHDKQLHKWNLVEVQLNS